MVAINKLSSLDEQSNKPKNNLSLDNAIDITQEFATGILNNNVSSNVKNAILNNSEKLEGFILDYISNHQSITGGQEGEVYVLNIEGKEVILAKKRYDNESKREYNLHKEAYKISKLSQSGVKVPEPIYEFNDGVNGYIVMEFIEGKTLYTKTWEAIINQHLIPYLKKYILHEKQDYIAAECELHDLSQKYGKDDQVTFSNDTQAEEGVIEYLDILYKLRIIDNNPNITTKDINRPHIRKNLALENYYKKHIGNTVVFDINEGNNFANKIRLFIRDLHDNGMYHRDLGGNPRNIMFTENQVYVIDFGKSEIGVGKGGYSNIDQISGGIYDDDEGIIHRIKGLTGEIKNDYENINNDERNNDIIKKGNELGLNITQNNIKLYESHLASINIDKYIDDLINNKDNSYNWFIYLSEKGADHEWKKKSNNIGKPKLFIVLNLLKKDKLNQILSKLKEVKSTSKSKASRGYKYAVFITNYINHIII